MENHIEFEHLNMDWNAEPNAPEVEVKVVGCDVIIEFYLNAFLYKQFSEGDKAQITFHECLQYRIGPPNEDGFYIYGKSRFKQYGVTWGEFYLVHNSNWKKDFQNPIIVSNTDIERQHYLFYFSDETFECIANSFSIKFLTENN